MVAHYSCYGSTKMSTEVDSSKKQRVSMMTYLFVFAVVRDLHAQVLCPLRQLVEVFLQALAIVHLGSIQHQQPKTWRG